MFRCWKQILAPGRFWVSNHETGEIQPVEFNADDCRQFCDTGNAMIRHGYEPPLPLEHQADASPLSAADHMARSVSHNTGRATRFRIDPTDESLWGRLEVHWLPDTPTEQIEEALKTRVRFVSPELLPRVTLGDGLQWRHVIRHIALTPTPIWLKQKPFGHDGAAMSQAARGALSWSGVRRPVRLSLADRVDDEEATLRRQLALGDELARLAGAVPRRR